MIIYLDSSATSFQKPRSVWASMSGAMSSMASPGRGSHRPAMLAADIVLKCREEIAGLFNVDDLEKVIFTLNATHALNIAIHSLIKPGDKVVISGYEHNAVTRPLRAIGAEAVIAESPLFDSEAAVRAFTKAIPEARCVICTHVSNVFGFILPIEKIAALCKCNHVPLIIDASQSAGSIDIDFSALGAAFMAMPGHKCLMGPQGTGVLLCKNGAEPMLAGGTGSDSINQDMPDYLPDRLEAGTHNIPGIAGLLAGVRYVRKRSPGAIMRHERRLMGMAAERLRRIDGLTVFVADDPNVQAGVLSILTEKIDNVIFAEQLGNREVAVRAGLHCAPTAHRTAGTLDTGTVRLSFSPFNTENEVRRACHIIESIINKM